MEDQATLGGRRAFATLERTWSRFLFCLCLYGVSQLLNAFIVAVAHDIVWRSALVDITASWIPPWPGGNLASFCALWISFGAVALLLLVHKGRWIIARRWLFLTGTLMLFRGLCLATTFLPPAFAGPAHGPYSCHPPSHDHSLAVVLARIPAILFVPAFASDRLICGDGMFSGKILLILSNCYTFNYYTPAWAWPARWALILIASFGFAAALVSRLHYTSDIFLSYVITTGCYTIYHTFCEIPAWRRRDSAYSRLWMSALGGWLEGEAPAGRLRNQLESPWTHACPLIRAKFAHWNAKCDGDCCRVVRWLRRNRFRTKI